MEDATIGNQPEHGEGGSDADTDELLSRADLLCSGASDKQRNPVKSAAAVAHTPAESPRKENASSSSSKLCSTDRSSVRRCLNFDLDKPASERKRHSKTTPQDFGVISLDRSQSRPSTPKTDASSSVNLKNIVFSPATSGQSAVVSIDSTDDDSRSASIPVGVDKRAKVVAPFTVPLNSFAIVQFTTNSIDDDSDEGSVSEKRLEALRSILSIAKNDLTNSSQLLVRAMTPNNNGSRSSDSGLGSSISTSLSSEERSFVERLSASELREWYEAEFCKRRYCEKKIDLLQKQLLDLEQKLSVATVAVDRYKNVVTNVEQSCNDFLAEVTTKEKERIREASALKRNNDQLKAALEQVIAYGQMLGEKLETCAERVQSLEKNVDDQSKVLCDLESENGKLKEESAVQQAEIASLRKKLEQSEAKRKASFEREDQLTKEMLTMERMSKENIDLVQKLKQELTNEKLLRRSQLEEKERQYKERVLDVAKEFDARVDKTRHEIEQRTASEMRKLKDEWDTVLYGLSEKYGRMVNERDEALKRLKEYEDTFNERQRVICYDLQQRLSAKYYELLSEFTPSGPASSSNDNPNTVDPPSDFMGNYVPAIGTSGHHYGAQGVDPAWFSSSMADEFLERLRNAYPARATPAHLRSEITNKDQTEQIAPGSISNQRACPSGEHSKKK